MKKLFFSLIICGLFCVSCDTTTLYQKDLGYVSAEVISINNHTLSGSVSGYYFGSLLSSEGSINGDVSDDVVRMSVRFKLDGDDYYEDLKMTHAVASYFANSFNSNKIQLWVVLSYFKHDDKYDRMFIYPGLIISKPLCIMAINPDLFERLKKLPGKETVDIKG